ncbi:MAG TPA: 3-deoxy-manno-octulosonate cytidylyltransferase [Vicinamibacterales bacterium]|nr:3-deoxy-manno-octulosonate cytidylyltransferase [Vicinamibacterales bacterium]
MPPVSHSGPLSVVAIIPARFHSTRLPAKALAEIAGRPMIQHVYERAAMARRVARVIVATDDERIANVVRAFGGDVRMTAASHRSGTDRLAEVAASLECDLVVNVQGDEPMVEPGMIDEAVEPFAADPDLQLSTLRRPAGAADLQNPHVTKVVVDRDGYALYFSRAPIPFVREGAAPPPVWRHVGLYAYRRACLITLAALPPTALELAESLEQLRALEYGIRIKTVESAFDTIGVDTQEDLDRVRRLMGAPAQA